MDVAFELYKIKLIDKAPLAKRADGAEILYFYSLFGRVRGIVEMLNDLAAWVE